MEKPLCSVRDGLDREIEGRLVDQRGPRHATYLADVLPRRRAHFLGARRRLVVVEWLNRSTHIGDL
jgi:hypothetical protein